MVPVKDRMLAYAFALCALCSSCTGGRRDFLVAVHALSGSEEETRLLIRDVPKLARAGVDALFVEIGYGFAWASHPELRPEGALLPETARELSEACRKNGIEIIPEINCVGHQSWESEIGALLARYPRFDETPGLYPGNEGIYCRSWCVSNPEVYPIIFDLVDEIVGAFGASGVHVGMDEILLIGEDACPRCRGKDRSELLAGAINRLHDHIVKEKGLAMYLWGDRLIDGRNPRTDYSDDGWETSLNDTYRAVDLIPKDIVICDWHYGAQAEYGSVPFFLDKGFKVLPTSYRDVEAAGAFIDYSLRYRENTGMLGHLYAPWGEVANDSLHSWTPLLRTAGKLK